MKRGTAPPDPTGTHLPVESVTWIFAIVFLLLCIGAIIVASGR
jgi:hypothetical protein